MYVFAHSARFDDADAFVATMNASGGKVVPMTRGPWQARLEVIGLGPLRLYRGAVPPQIRQGAVALGDLMMTSRTAPGSCIHQGREFHPGDVVLMGVGMPIETHFRAPAVWTGAEFDPGRLARMAEGWTSRVPGAERHAILDLGARGHAALMAEVEAGIAAGVGTAGLLARPAALAGLQDAMEQAILRLLAGAAWRDTPRATGDLLRIVRRANDWVAAHPMVAPSIGALAEAQGIAPRTLHRAFAAVYGCSPLTHMRRLRLHQVRAALLAREGAPLVKTAALDRGFWHLGRFSQEYQARFGEHPSQTRAAARRTTTASIE